MRDEREIAEAMKADPVFIATVAQLPPLMAENFIATTFKRLREEELRVHLDTIGLDAAAAAAEKGVDPAVAGQRIAYFNDKFIDKLKEAGHL